MNAFEIKTREGTVMNPRFPAPVTSAVRPESGFTVSVMD